MTDLPERPIAIQVPAEPAYLRHVRVVAATVADDAGFDVDAIESWRIAVDELCALAMADAVPGAMLEVTMRAEAGSVLLEGRCGPVEDDPELDPIAEALLRAGSTAHTLDREGEDCTFTLRADLDPAGAR